MLFTCSGAYDVTIMERDVKTLEARKNLTGHTKAVCCLLLSGSFLFSGSEDTNVRTYTPLCVSVCLRVHLVSLQMFLRRIGKGGRRDLLLLHPGAPPSVVIIRILDCSQCAVPTHCLTFLTSFISSGS
jgi:hypothetical protein